MSLLIGQVAPGQLPAVLLCSYPHNIAGREEELWGGGRRGRRIEVEVGQRSVFNAVSLLVRQVALGQLPAV